MALNPFAGLEYAARLGQRQRSHWYGTGDLTQSFELLGTKLGVQQIAAVSVSDQPGQDISTRQVFDVCGLMQSLARH